MVWRRPKQVSVKLTVPFVGEVGGIWEPADVERRAAWELYLQLASRITVEELPGSEGILREALTSYHNLFEVTRGILTKYGPEVAPRVAPEDVTFGKLAMTVLNRVLRPVLAAWHPRLGDYEATRPVTMGRAEHEQRWQHAAALRAVLDETRGTLAELYAILGEVAEADLTVSVKPPAPRRPTQPAGGGYPEND